MRAPCWPQTPYDSASWASLLAVVLCVWAFVAVADRVTAGSTQAMDEQLMRSLRKAGSQ